ncbi:MAG: hypothetical protein PHW82_11395 [Bacteroidales bacterium]|nr:hypothetical protein [Bacteroidales bacterium]
MKNSCLFCICLFYVSCLLSQTIAEKNLEYWQTNFSRTEQLYSEIIELAKIEASDSLIYIKSIDALNCVKLGIAQCEAAKINNPYFTDDANYRVTRSCIQAAWFNQIEQTKQIFTDSLARYFIDKCFLLRPTVTSISYYELNYKLEKIDGFEQVFFDQVFLRFLHAVEDGQTKTVVEMGNIYIDDMYFVYGNGFPAIIFTNPELMFEQNRIYRIVTELIPLTDDSRQMLSLQMLMLEYIANFYFEQKFNDDTFSLNDNEINTISECEDFISKNIRYADEDKTCYLRLADAFFLLNKYQKCVDYFSRAILNTEASKKDLKHFIEFTKQIVDTNKDSTCVAYCKQQINKACLLYRDQRNVLDDEEELEFLKDCFVFAGNLDMAQKFRDRIQKLKEQQIEQEKKRQKMEMFSVRLGFAPFKLFYINKYHQFSIMGDIKIKGFEQGFRYCRYNGFEDKYRFGAWMYVPDEQKSSNTYTGNEFSYWITILNHYEENLEHKLCLEARLANYKFDTVNVNIINREFDYIQFYDWPVSPVAHRYDISFVYRATIFAADIFFFEVNFALGLGYRYLKTNFNNKVFIIDDVRYSDDRWPSITAPIRLGFRAGIRIF